MTSPANVQPIRPEQPEEGISAVKADAPESDSMLTEALKRRAEAEQEALRTDPTKNGLAAAVVDGLKAVLIVRGLPPEDLTGITFKPKTDFKSHEFAGSVDGRPFRLAIDFKNPHKSSQPAIDYDRHVLALTAALKRVAANSKKQNFGAEPRKSGANETTLCLSASDAPTLLAGVSTVIQQAGFKPIDAAQYPSAVATGRPR